MNLYRSPLLDIINLLGCIRPYFGTHQGHVESSEETNQKYIGDLLPKREGAIDYLHLPTNCHPVEPNKINVHLIPHSHDDVGWLKTPDQYYYGSKSYIQRAGVQYIISAAIDALRSHPDRRYLQVETYFFHQWWINQNEETKRDVIELVNNGQLEIAGGAWSMNDEGCVNYQSTIDQFTWGLRFLNDSLGECGAPKTGWQIDPFGHSQEQASIFAQLGFDAVFFARLDFQDKIQRIKNKSMEVMWKTSNNFDDRHIFTNIFPIFYGAPDGFCYDIECSDEVINDNVGSPDYNLQRKVKEFSKIIQKVSGYYRTSNVLIPMGGDFQFQGAAKNYANMDKLIKGFQNNDKIHVMYSTPSCYVKAVNEESREKHIEFPIKEQDFFPYASDVHQYWTGYFTSRPNSKQLERLANNILQGAKQVATFYGIDRSDQAESLKSLREAMGILQHHDAITGTSKFAVQNNYVRLLTRAIKESEKVIANLAEELEGGTTKKARDSFHTCLLSNISVCDATGGDHFTVAVYNPLSRLIPNAYVRIPVPNDQYTVSGPEGHARSQLLSPIRDFKDLVSKLKPKAKELLFETGTLHPFGMNLYSVTLTKEEAQGGKGEEDKLEEQTDARVEVIVELDGEESNRFGDELRGFAIDNETGLLSSVWMNGATVKITQEMLYYKSSNKPLETSGAYIFNPLYNIATSISDGVNVTKIRGDLVDEVHQVFNDWVTQIIRVHKNEDDSYIEFDWVVGPIPGDTTNLIGTEVVSRFTVSNFENSGIFYTDSNGREMIKRVRNGRPDYHYNYTQDPVSSNYYPINSKIFIEDVETEMRIAVLTDRSQGGGSLSDGSLELMVHRRCLMDDGKGVDEALNDYEYRKPVAVRGQHYLVIGSSKSSGLPEDMSAAAKERMVALKKLLRPIVLVKKVDKTSLKADLPQSVHILTLEPWKDDGYLIRLEHLLEKGEDINLSANVTVNLNGLFPNLDITTIRETTLGANQWLDEFNANPRMLWNIENKKHEEYSRRFEKDNFETTLTPMQIRTFIITVSRK